MARRHIDRPRAIEAICKALEEGNTRRAAAAAAGITHDTLYQWLKQPDISDVVEKAEAAFEMRHVRNISKVADDGTWQASAWLLERHPKTKHDWRRSDELDTRKLSIDQLLALATASERGAETTGDRLAAGSSEER